MSLCMNKVHLVLYGEFWNIQQKGKRCGAYHLHNKSVKYLQYKNTTIKFQFVGEENSARFCLFSLKDKQKKENPAVLKNCSYFMTLLNWMARIFLDLDFPIAISRFHVHMVSTRTCSPCRGVTVIEEGLVRNLRSLYASGKLPTYPSLKGSYRWAITIRDLPVWW